MSDALRNESAVDYSFGPYRFDGRLRRLYRDEEPIALTPKALDTLAALLERAGRVVEKDELLRAVWNDVFVGEDTLAQNISTLRRVLGDDPTRPQFIATIPRRGYKFVAALRTVPPMVVGGTAQAQTATTTRPNKKPLALAGAAAVIVALAGLAAWRVSVSNRPRAAVEFTITEPASSRFSAAGGMLAASPDGQYLSFVVVDAIGSSSLWLRPLASTVARRLDGTDGAANPFWSPDSRTIAFFSERRLKAVDVASGAVRVVASLASPRSMGGSWSRRGQILFSIPADGMYLVPASGGSPERLAPALDPNCEDCGTWPHFLPDGRRFLYTVASSQTAQPGIYMGELGKPGGQLLLDAVSSCSYLPSGFLFYARSGTLYVQRFDTGHRRVTGTAIPLSDGVAYNARTGRVIAAISDTGVLAFRKALITELVWVDRAGTPQGTAAPPAIYHDFSIAPDGWRVAAARVDPRTSTSDIWIFDSGRELRVTDDSGWDGDPVWSADGHDVAYSSRRDGRWQIFRRPATAVGPEELLLEADTQVSPLQILPSRQIVYTARRAKGPFDVWKLRGQKSSPLARIGGFYPGDAQLSPDERWLAYGRPETSGAVWSQTVYVSAIPFGEGRRAVAEAASTPRWRADGRELFYLAKDSTVVAMPVDPRQTPSESAGEVLFRASGLAPTGVSGQVYDVTPDGLRFLLKREVGPSAIHVVLNWDSGLRR
jgi:DNA-binding winged helix-turn-helix (wHTH) protein/Tol biopolymer transport system component